MVLVPVKQQKITKLFRKIATRAPQDPEVEELNEEVQNLEKLLQEKQNELFQIQRNNLKRKVVRHKKESNNNMIVRPENIIQRNAVESLKRELELLALGTGIEVQSYEADSHCCIVFHMQHKSEHIVTHGLRIEISTDGKVISKSALPLGFKFQDILDEHDRDVMTPECLQAVRRGLVAYYSRSQQYQDLKTLLKTDGELAKTTDTSNIEISFYVLNTLDSEAQMVQVTLELEYRVYDIRPKTYICMCEETETAEGASEILNAQCAVFKKKPLRKAFKEAFVSGAGTYRLVDLTEPAVKQTKRSQKRPPHHKRNYNNDDTFQPDDCSDLGDDDADMFS